MTTATKKKKKKLTLGRPALVAGTQQNLSNLLWRLSIPMDSSLYLLVVNFEEYKTILAKVLILLARMNSLVPRMETRGL
jgi:hypothetical protein